MPALVRESRATPFGRGAGPLREAA
jgi:hypothetical protein